MFLLPASGNLAQVEAVLRRTLPASRFRCMIQYARARYGGRGNNSRLALELSAIRLRSAKPYCGQHAGPCRVTFPRRHKVGCWLEGADWVGWGDMLNDFCDRARIKADIWSHGAEFYKPYFVRRGAARRTCHHSIKACRLGGFGKLVRCDWDDPKGFEVWDWDESRAEFSTAHFGVKRDAPRSVFPDGTPGIPEWRAWKSRKLERLAREAIHAH